MAIFVVSHEKGGVGKTTLTFNLTKYFSGFIPTKVIDLDSNRMFTALNDFRKLSGLEPFDVVPPDQMAGNLFTDILNEYRGAPDKLLVIDSGGYDSTINSKVAAVADFILTPAGNTMVEIMGLKKFQTVLDRIREAKKIAGLGDDKLPCYVVFNKAHPNTKNFKETDLGLFLQRSEHYSMLDTVIRDRRTYNNTLIDGGHTVIEKGTFDAKEELLNLGIEISDILFNKLEGDQNG